MNMKKIIGIALVVVFVVGGAYFLSVKENRDGQLVQTMPVSRSVFDAKNASYEIEGAIVTLVNGVSEGAGAPDSAIKTITRYFGNEARGDLDGDGTDEIAFLISQDRGGSGLFYYAAVAMQTPNGYTTTNTFFIGDRIAPQVNTIMNGKLYVDYAERYPGEPMTARPSLGAEKVLVISSDGALVEFVKQ